MTRRMNCWLWCLAGGLFATPVLADDWGGLRGRFLFGGEPPAAKKIAVTKDAAHCGKHPLVDESLLVGKDKAIANVIVYVRTPKVNVHPDLAEAVKPTVLLDNAGCRFEPHITTLWVDKQLLLIRNSDPVLHNVNLQPFGDRGINPIVAVNKTIEHRLTKSQTIPIQVVCNLHPWMKGYVLPRDNPYVAVTGKDGVFKLDKLPVGELEFQAWHEAVGYVRITGWKRGRFKLTIKDGVQDLGDITIPAELFRPRR